MIHRETSTLMQSDMVTLTHTNLTIIASTQQCFGGFLKTTQKPDRINQPKYEKRLEVDNTAFHFVPPSVSLVSPKILVNMSNSNN